MWSYFGGWKRKLGAVTLLVTLVFAYLWFRSLRNETTIISSNEPHSISRLLSRRGSLVCEHFQSEHFIAMYVPSVISTKEHVDDDGFQSFIYKYDAADPLVPPFDRYEKGVLRKAVHVIVWKWRWLGFSHGVYDPSADPDFDAEFRSVVVRVTSVPYWSFVVPLALISAWCLMDRQQSNSSQPGTPTRA